MAPIPVAVPLERVGAGANQRIGTGKATAGAMAAAARMNITDLI